MPKNMTYNKFLLHLRGSRPPHVAPSLFAKLGFALLFLAAPGFAQDGDIPDRVQGAFDKATDALVDKDMNFEDSGVWGNWRGSAPDCAEINYVVGNVIANDLRDRYHGGVVFVARGYGYWAGFDHIYIILVVPGGTYVYDPWYYNDGDLHPVDVDNLPYPPSYLIPISPLPPATPPTTPPVTPTGPTTTPDMEGPMHAGKTKF
jgi:hypothetical protein